MSCTSPSTWRRTRSGSGAQTEKSTGSDMRGPPGRCGGGSGEMMPGRRAANPGRRAGRPGTLSPAARAWSPVQVLTDVDAVGVVDGRLVLGVEGAPADAVR